MDNPHQVIYSSIAYALAAAELENKPQSDGISAATNQILDDFNKVHNAAIDAVVETLDICCFWSANTYNETVKSLQSLKK